MLYLCVYVLLVDHPATCSPKGHGSGSDSELILHCTQQWCPFVVVGHLLPTFTIFCSARELDPIDLASEREIKPSYYQISGYIVLSQSLWPCSAITQLLASLYFLAQLQAPVLEPRQYSGPLVRFSWQRGIPAGFCSCIFHCDNE